jgi:hypothetical protein
MRQIARAILFVLLVAGAAQGQQPAAQLDKTSIGGTGRSIPGRGR